MGYNGDLIVSFVHAYHDESVLSDGLATQPGLWVPSQHDLGSVHAFPFPRVPADFHEDSVARILRGTMPPVDSKPPQRLPRFGLTGLATTDRGTFLAGSWNAVYEIEQGSYELRSIISNQLMSDLHGIAYDNSRVFTILTGKDTLVISETDGRIIESMTIDRTLRITRNDDLSDVDWRFVSKQFRGATGFFHFNYVRIEGNTAFMTSRNLNAVIALDLDTMKVELVPLALKTTALIHDGIRDQDGALIFTSIDGKILRCTQLDQDSAGEREHHEQLELYERAMNVDLIRLEQRNFGRAPNWLRGIAVHEDSYSITVDGLYGGPQHFGVANITQAGTLNWQQHLPWADIGDPGSMRFATGFDVLKASERHP